MAVKVVELFAGVGGFRLGLDRRAGGFETVWFNQWEPATKVQHAYDCYVENFLKDQIVPTTCNQDITKVPTKQIPKHDLLVGGFPCQDYSVASTLDKSGGLEGKKGVLWWEIRRIIEDKRPPYVLLENVDRLLKSPARQRGRDFAVLLACLRDLGYRVEWRVINAADYGNAQRRRRVFIFAAHKRTAIGRYISKHARQSNYLLSEGYFASEFKISYDLELVEEVSPTDTLAQDVREISSDYTCLFQNSGVMVDGAFWTRKVIPDNEPSKTLGSIMESDGVSEEYLFDESQRAKWEYAKGSKTIQRTAKNGHDYVYSEGAMQFPDLRKAPARTLLTSEASRTPNRSTHVVTDPKTGTLRFLTPIECERLNGFDDGWTKSVPQRWRYFTMGNALVVPLVTRMGKRLIDWIEQMEPKTRRKRMLGPGGLEVPLQP